MFLRFSRFPRKIFAVIFIAVGILTLIGGAAWAIYSQHFVANATRTTGRIVEMIRRDDNFFPVFSYVDASGKEHKIYSNAGSYPPAHEVGDTVPVLYIPGQESGARLNEWFTLWGVPIVLAIIGGVDLPLGIVVLLWPRITKKQSLL